MDAYASNGMPIGYHHWSFGKRFLATEQVYKRGAMGLAYEIVINSNPCIAYLLEENTMPMQALVIAHACYGHNSFFKGNYLFRAWTQADAIIDYLAVLEAVHHRVRAALRRGGGRAGARRLPRARQLRRRPLQAAAEAHPRPGAAAAQGARGAPAAAGERALAHAAAPRRGGRGEGRGRRSRRSRRRTCSTSSRSTRRCSSPGSARSRASCASSSSTSTRSARRRS